MITDIEQPTNQPPRIIPAAIDLAVFDSDQGEQVVLRVICAETGARIDVVMKRAGAAAFGRSLAEFASAEPAWL
jgi:hypothetical protein